MIGHASSFEANFLPTDNYVGERLDPPYPGTGENPRRKSLNETQKKQYSDGEVFTICYSKKATINYYWDLLPTQLPDDDVPHCSKKPSWGISMSLANNTTINWGPWCDRQRDLIWKFYNPIDTKEWSYPTEPQAELFKFDLRKSTKSVVE